MLERQHQAQIDDKTRWHFDAVTVDGGHEHYCTVSGKDSCVGTELNGERKIDTISSGQSSRTIEFKQAGNSAWPADQICSINEGINLFRAQIADQSIVTHQE